MFLVERKKVLIVDDEPDIRDMLSILLASNGYTAVEAKNGVEAVNAVKENHDFDLVILDVMMPEMDGIDALREIRKFSNVPALFLTAKTAESDKADAYYNGGDDYLSKPFSQSELLMKVTSLVRRYREYGNSLEHIKNIDSLKSIRIDADRHIVYKNEVDVGLTDTEYILLNFFIKHRGTPNDAKSIYEAVWQERYLPSAANTVMVHILNLRRKIEDDPTQPEIIKTVWGKGYQID